MHAAGQEPNLDSFLTTIKTSKQQRTEKDHKGFVCQFGRSRERRYRFYSLF